MGVPTSEVGYTTAMPGREEHEVHKNMWWHWIKKIYIYIFIAKPLLLTDVSGPNHSMYY
jgi:ABC-type arginine/histidine transport system permease subunit